MNISQPPDSVRGYLNALRRALKGAPKGLIADALADCEEHLNMEIAQNPEMDEAAVMAQVIETYGSPEEIAEEYRDMEASISTPFPKAPETNEISRNGGFFNVISDPRTYGALLYMLLSLMTGIFYFVWTVAGLSISLSTSILIFGIFIALLFIASIRLLSHVEGRIVEGLLGVRMPRRLPLSTASDEKLWTQIKEALGDVRTWTSIAYLLLMLPLGVVYFVIAVVGLSVSLGVTGGCIYSLLTNESHISISDLPWLEHLFHTAPGLILLALVGVLLFFVVLHVARAIGWMHGKIAEALLVRL
ncbi:putative membrane protein [Rhizomicrobium palustre]|uniref:Putative membrane protein n=1 Tax=Rhizomicrobium palustre TaxID=189966 RepID=A0A846N399_9PROT|nr:sensor domain-containing protein [Rhizomicrobium palustre]NIK89989.1 putative membrane protein [Rhizomicrobium palustre]